MISTENYDELVYDVIKKIRENRFCEFLKLFGQFLIYLICA